MNPIAIGSSSGAHVKESIRTIAIINKVLDEKGMVILNENLSRNLIGKCREVAQPNHCDHLDWGRQFQLDPIGGVGLNHSIHKLNVSKITLEARFSFLGCVGQKKILTSFAYHRNNAGSWAPCHLDLALGCI